VREVVTVSIWLTIGLVVAWVVLVVVRSPSADAGDQLAARIDLVIAETLLAERVQSFAYWICSVCTLLVIGGTIFRFFVVPPHVGVVGPDGTVHAQTRRPAGGNVGEATLRGAAVVGIVAAAFLVPLRTIALSGGRISAARDTDALWFVLDSRFGDAAVLRIAGLSILLLALADGPRLWRGGASRVGQAGRETLTDRATRRRATFVCGTLVVLLGYAMTGHPQATNPWVVHVAAQWVHITVAAAWFGGVTFLGIELRQQWRKGSARYTGEVVGRFSSMAEVTIIVAAVTGVLLANSQIHDPTAVLQSAYGRAFVGKMIALGVVLAIGGYNQQRLVPAIVERDEEAAWDHMRKALVFEVTLIALGVLLMTAAMTSGGI
jgi:putative copper export protein